MEVTVRGIGHQCGAAAEAIQVVGRIPGQISDGAMDRTGGPEADGKLASFVQRKHDHAVAVAGVALRLIRCSCGRRVTLADRGEAERLRQLLSDQMLP